MRDAVYEPVRKCQNANYFLKIIENGQEWFMPVTDNEKNQYNQGNLVKISLGDIKGEQLRVPDVTVADFRLAL